MIRLVLIAMLALGMVPSIGRVGIEQAWAVLPEERLADPVLEARARGLGQQLRCLVCQNETIDDSNADLAHDLRVLVRQRLVAGDTDPQVLAYLQRRYGDFVLLRPPVKPVTWLLWFGPAALLVGGLAGLVLVARRRRALEPAPLTRGEERRLEALLAEAGPAHRPSTGDDR